MHSRIESASKMRSIFTQSHWCDIMRTAKTEEPKYAVHEMQQNEIYDFAKFTEKKFWSWIKISTVSEIKVYPDKKIEFIYDYGNVVNVKNIDFNENQKLDICYKSKIQLDKMKQKETWIKYRSL